MSDAVNHPKHYTSHPSGVECITITRHMGFNLGSALKYIWRADLKADAIEDLNKSMWYLHDEIVKRGGEPAFVPLEEHEIPPYPQDQCEHYWVPANYWVPAKGGPDGDVSLGYSHCGKCDTKKAF